MIGEAFQGMKLTAKIHHEDGSYWAQVAEFPGCFATGDTLDELLVSLREEIQLYLDDDDASDTKTSTPDLQISSAVLTDVIPA